MELPTMALRHMYDLGTNDATASFCGQEGGLIRQTVTNVNCPKCLEKLAKGARLLSLIDAMPLLAADLPHDVAPEGSDQKSYLVCDGCGEAFDTIETANDHELSPDCPNEATYTIKPESEAL